MGGESKKQRVRWMIVTCAEGIEDVLKPRIFNNC